MDYTVHGILQARILEWIAFPFSRESSQPGDQTQLSRIASGFFTSWATRKKKKKKKSKPRKYAESQRHCSADRHPRDKAMVFLDLA